jgi:hypothetical protein
VNLYGDADQELVALVASHFDDHLQDPDPDPQNNYVHHPGNFALPRDFTDKFYFVHGEMNSDAMQGFSHTEIRIYKGGKFTVFFSGPTRH